MKPASWIVAAGAVIIDNDRVLLVREQKEALSDWFFPGGQYEDYDRDFEATAIREAKEEVGLDVTLIKPLRPTVLQTEKNHIVLLHFLATYSGTVSKGKDGLIAAAEWHSIHNLPKNSAPNVAAIINEYLRMV